MMFLASRALAGEIHSNFPTHIDADGEYLIYSHGRIVEGENPTPMHERSRAAARSTALTSFAEIAITTGKEHGAFYAPLPEWVEPVLHWIQQGREL